MSELTSVPGPSSPLKGNSGKAVLVIIVAITLAVIKPWGVPSAAPVLPSSQVPTAPPTSAASATAQEAFDFGVFEGFEPPPAWEIWPAGREISFGFAMKVDGDADTSNESPAPSPDDTPAGSAEASGPSAVAAGPTSPLPEPDGDPPTWSEAITISPVSTLTVVAINMPLAYRIPFVRLSRLQADGGRVEVPVIRLRSPWPSHFLVIGLDDGSGTDALAAWPPGEYALDLHIDPGGWARSITIDVRARPPATSPSPRSFATPEPSFGT